MNHRKLNISRWYALGLAALLLAGCMVLAVGTSLARYRYETQKKLLFEPRAPIAVMVTKLTGTGALDTKTAVGWEKQEDGKLLLNFAVTNVTSAADAEEVTWQEQDLEFRVRLVGSLKAWTEDQAEDVTEEVILTDGTLLQTTTGSPETAKEKEFVAEVMRIPENTSLYHSFGDGWVFRFLDEEGEELTWELEGGVLSCVELDITIDASAVSDTSLLQLQIIAETA